MTQGDTLILIPTYNEAENIGALLERLLVEIPSADILIIDDASPDGTGNTVKTYASRTRRIQLLERKGKEGLAKAYIAGFSWGLSKGYHRLVQMDADLSHDPEYLPSLLSALDTAHVAVGCRYMPGAGTVGWSALRECISRGGNLYARTLLGLPFQDLTGGFNAWRRETLEGIRFETIRWKGYGFQVELKYRAHSAGFKIAELPIQFRERRSGISKMNGGIVMEAALAVIAMRWWNCR